MTILNSQVNAPLVLHLAPRKLALLVAGFSVLVIALGYLRMGQLLFGVPIDAMHLRILDFNAELVLPAWYTSALLAATGALMLWAFMPSANRKLQLSLAG